MKKTIIVVFNISASLLFLFGLGGCSTAPIYSTQLLVRSANEELNRSQKLVNEVKDTYQDYIGAHKYMIRSKPLDDIKALKAMHGAMKDVRLEAKKTIQLHRQIEQDKAKLESVLNTTSSISEGSESYSKIASLVDIYGHGKEHPEIEKQRQRFNASVATYSELISENSGYLTDAKSLRKNFQKDIKEIEGSLDDLSARVIANYPSPYQQELELLKSQFNEIQQSLKKEIPPNLDKVILFPGMVTFSVVDRMATLKAKIQELKKKLP
jgi:hypothetical protein